MVTLDRRSCCGEVGCVCAYSWCYLLMAFWSVLELLPEAKAMMTNHYLTFSCCSRRFSVSDEMVRDDELETLLYEVYLPHWDIHTS